jgi:hypothetical protein
MIGELRTAPPGQGMALIGLHALDIGVHRLVDTGTQAFGQGVAGAEQIAHRLRAAAQGLVQKFALVAM